MILTLLEHTMTATAAVYLTAFTGAAIVGLPRMWSWWRWNNAGRSATHFEVVRAGNGPEDYATAETDLNTFGRQVSVNHPARAGFAFHIYRDPTDPDDDAIHRVLTIYGHRDPNIAAKAFGSATGSVLNERDWDPPMLGRPCGQRRYGRTPRPPSRNDPPAPTATADWINAQLADATEPIMVTWTFEPVISWEAQEINVWHNHRSSMVDKTEGIGVGVPFRVSATAYGTESAELLKATPARLFRYVFDARVWPITGRRTAIAVVAAAAVTWVVAVAAAAVDGRPVAAMIAHPATWVLAAATLAALSGQPNLAARVRTRRFERDGLTTVERVWRFGLWRQLKNFVARSRLGPAFTKEIADRTSESEDGARTVTRTFPFRDTTLVYAPGHASQIVALPSPLDTGSATGRITAARNAPASIRHADGIRLGFDLAGNAARISYTDRYAGIFYTGDPGKGKTWALLNVAFGDLTARRHGLGVPGAGPVRNGKMGLIWLETKGQTGMAEIAQVAKTAGYGPNDFGTINIASDHGARLELFDRTRPFESAERLVGAFMYAHDEGDIRGRAAEALRAVFSLVLSLSPADSAAIGIAGDPNIMEFAALLLGNDAHTKTLLWERITANAHADLARIGGRANTQPIEDLAADGVLDTTGSAVSDSAISDALGESGSKLYDAWAVFSYYERLPRRQYAELMESPRNKITALARVRTLWQTQPGRDAVSLAQLIECHAAVAINFGSTSDGQSVDTTITNRLTSMTMFLLWEEIRGRCAGWERDGRSTGIYCDEVRAVAGGGSGNDVIRELFDAGRSYGIELALATQRYDQLPERTRKACLSFGTRAYLGTENFENAQAAIADLTGADPRSPFGPEDIRTLPLGQSLARVRCEGHGAAPFNLVFASLTELDLEGYLNATRALPPGTP